MDLSSISEECARAKASQLATLGRSGVVASLLASGGASGMVASFLATGGGFRAVGSYSIWPLEGTPS